MIAIFRCSLNYLGSCLGIGFFYSSENSSGRLVGFYEFSPFWPPCDVQFYLSFPFFLEFVNAPYSLKDFWWFWTLSDQKDTFSCLDEWAIVSACFVLLVLHYNLQLVFKNFLSIFQYTPTIWIEIHSLTGCLWSR